MTKARSVPKLACAVYTRKSTEEGLEQEFNSLQAQREACEAYIESQRHEGWLLLSEAYDDGGVSGGTLERPALQLLLTDIEARKIDVVVVYKVDRLTRSLADFAKIVETFDRHGVSFVSVTQQFNTTTSMGRLTLNVLLSFAQFEREVTGERIRDKFLASRQKGLWMGGHPPLGYDLKERKLHVNEAESELVRRIFTAYADCRCIRTLRDQLHAEGAASKQRISQAGIAYGGMPFSTGALYKILGNRTYLGLAVHKGKAYPGEHAAIVDQDLWDRVQEQLARNRVRRLGGTHAKQASLLAGFLYDADGRRLTPSHATKGKRRYRYYVTPAARDTPPKAIDRPWRLPAREIEDRIRSEIFDLLKSPARLDAALGLETTNITEKLPLYQAAGDRATALQAALPATLRSFLQIIVARITLRDDSIEMTLRPARLQHAILQPQDSRAAEATSYSAADDDRLHRLVIKTRLKRCGSELRLVLCDGPNSERLPRPNAGLIKTIAKAHLWAKQLIDGEVSNIAEIAKREGTSRPHASRILSLAFLAPDLVAAILDGRHPPEVTVETLTKVQRLPLGWEDQRRILGFP
jgi:DNA invertase Pin-like site-specific DNA recombinase